MSNKNIVIGIVVVVLLVVGMYVTRAKNSSAPAETPPPSTSTPPPASSEDETDSSTAPATANADCVRSVDQAKMKAEVTDIKSKFVVLTIQGYGDIKVQLADADAPKTVANFLKLADAGFYNCLTFHRILDLDPDPKIFGRMIQGGDPEGTGMGGPGYTVPAEIKLPHVKGAIAMARTGDQVNPTRASSGSQFYITVDPLPFLDNQYTVFGQVVGGMDVVEKISGVKTDPAGMPATPVVIEKAVITNK